MKLREGKNAAPSIIQLIFFLLDLRDKILMNVEIEIADADVFF